MTGGESRYESVDELAEEFAERLRNGEHPSLTEYVDRYPELADGIRDVFPALVAVEAANGAVDRDAASSVDGPYVGDFGDYRLLREVGRGGMGIVYEAQQLSLGRHVALKILPSQAMMNSRHIQRFQREAQAAAQLNHAHIVSVYGVGEHDGTHFLAMQFVPGQSLAEILEELRRMKENDAGAFSPLDSVNDLSNTLSEIQTCGINPDSVSDHENHDVVADDGGGHHRDPHEGALASTTVISAGNSTWSNRFSLLRSNSSVTSRSGSVQYFNSVARLGVQAADALTHAHEHGVLHRDIKPSNLMLDPGANLLVTDFGLAKITSPSEPDEGDLTQTGDIVGTLRYMAPERFQGWADPRSDVYSLGLTLYELSTLQPGFDETDRGRLIRQVTQEVPTRPRKLNHQIPRDLETIILKSIEKEPASRYQSARELFRDLQRFLDGKPIQARNTPMRERLVLWCRRNPLVACLACLLFVAFLGTTGLWWSERVQRRLATQNFIEAQRQEKIADENFDHAMEIVEAYLNRVSDQRLEDWPGMQPLRRELLQLATDYYNKFVEDHESDPLLKKELARSHLRLGDLARVMGDRDRALHEINQSIRLYRESVASTPNVSESWARLAECQTQLGSLHHTAGEMHQALESYHKAIDLGNRFLARGSYSDTDPINLAISYNLRGVTLMSLGMLSDAEESYESAIALLVEHESNSTELKAILHRAVPLSNLGVLHQKRGEWERAADSYQESISITRALLSRSPRPWMYADLAGSLSNLGAVQMQVGQREKALSSLKECVDIRKKLAADNPTVETYQIDLAHAHVVRSTTHRELGSFTESNKELSEALKIFDHLFQQDPEAPMLATRLASCYLDMGQLANAEDSLDEAVDHIDDSMKLITDLQLKHGKLLESQNLLARGYSLLGIVSQKAEKPRAAVEHHERAAEITEDIIRAHPDIYEYKSDLIGRYTNIGALLRLLGDRDAASAMYIKAIKVADELRDQGTLSSSAVVAMAGTCCNVGNITNQSDQPIDALPWFDKAITTLVELLDREGDHPTAALFLSNSHVGRAITLRKTERLEEAVLAWEAAIQSDNGQRHEHFRMQKALVQARTAEFRHAVDQADDLSAHAEKDGKVLLNAALVHGLAIQAAEKDTAVQKSNRLALINRYEARAIELLRALFELKESSPLSKIRQFHQYLRVKPEWATLQSRDDFKQLLSDVDERLKE